MKRFVIKNANGSEQYVMPTVHDTRKKAEEALMSYVCNYNRDADDDEYLSLFDFVIEMQERTELSEIVPDFDHAKEVIGSSGFILAKKSFRFSGEELNSGCIDALIALNQLFTIAQAWNKHDGFVPDPCQEKWFPWFKYNKNTAKFVCEGATYSFVSTTAAFGLHVCFESRKRAEQFGRQFVGLYNQIFLL